MRLELFLSLLMCNGKISLSLSLLGDALLSYVFSTLLNLSCQNLYSNYSSLLLSMAYSQLLKKMLIEKSLMFLLDIVKAKIFALIILIGNLYGNHKFILYLEFFFIIKIFLESNSKK